jgi:hypothetical protein
MKILTLKHETRNGSLSGIASIAKGRRVQPAHEVTGSKGIEDLSANPTINPNRIDSLHVGTLFYEVDSC